MTTSRSSNRSHFVIFSLVCLSLLISLELGAELRVGRHLLASKVRLPTEFRGNSQLKQRKSRRQPKEGQLLVFRGGDQLSGELIKYDAGKIIQWKNKHAKEVIAFNPNELEEILFGDKSKTREFVQSKLVFRSGDTLAGEFELLEKDHLNFKTRFSPELKIPRLHMSSITLFRKSLGLILDGNGKLEDWTFGNNRNNNSWSQNGEAFITGKYNNSIARELKLPEKIHFEFDMVHHGNLYLNVYFFATNKTRLYQGNSYYMNISQYQVYLYYIRNGSSRNFGSNIKLPRNFFTNWIWHVDIYADRKSKRVVLLINGRLVNEWKNVQDIGKYGNIIAFQPQNNQMRLNLENVRVSEWDGRLAIKQGDVEQKQDSLLLINKDQISGDLLGIKDKKATLKTSFAEVEVPMERVRTVTFKKEKEAAKSKVKTNAKVHLVNNTSLSVNIKSIKEGKVLVEHPAFGETSLDLRAVTKISFEKK